MKASISFLELQDIIAEKAHQNINLAFVDRRTVRVTYPLKLGFIKKDISVNLIIKELVGTNLLVQLSAGMGTDTMLNTVLSLLNDKIPEGVIEKYPDSQLLIHLGEIEQLKTVFENIQVNNIQVIGDGIEVDGVLNRLHNID